MIAGVAPRTDEHEVAFHIECDAVSIVEQRVLALQNAKGLVIAIRFLAINHHSRRILNGDVNLTLLFVGRCREVSMRSIQLADGRNVTVRAAGEHDHAVGRIHRDRMNVAGLRIDIETVVVFVQRLRSLDHALRCRSFSARRRVLQTVEHFDAEQIGVLKDHFVALRIDCDRTVDRIRILDRADGRSRDLRCIAFGVNRCLGESREKILLFERSDHARVLRRRFRWTDFAVVGQFLDGNQARSPQWPFYGRQRHRRGNQQQCSKDPSAHNPPCRGTKRRG